MDNTGEYNLFIGLFGREEEIKQKGEDEKMNKNKKMKMKRSKVAVEKEKSAPNSEAKRDDGQTSTHSTKVPAKLN